MKKVKDITENLTIILEGLYSKEKQVNEIVLNMQGASVNGPGFLNKSINELEYTIIQYLGGNRRHLSNFREMDKEIDPFYNFEYGNITRNEFLKQIKKVIELETEPY